MVSRERLKEVLSYNPRDGEFIWISPNKNHMDKMHKVAGTICVTKSRPYSKYINIFIDGKGYRAHRLAWLYHYGEWPEVVDHINGDTLDNSIKNLRSVDCASNSQNHNYKKRANKKTNLPLGVRELKRVSIPSKYEGRILISETSFSCAFGSIEEASNFYCAMRYILHDFPKKEHLLKKYGVAESVAKCLLDEKFVSFLKKEGLYRFEDIKKYYKHRCYQNLKKPIIPHKIGFYFMGKRKKLMELEKKARDK